MYVTKMLEILKSLKSYLKKENENEKKEEKLKENLSIYPEKLKRINQDVCSFLVFVLYFQLLIL